MRRSLRAPFRAPFRALVPALAMGAVLVGCTHPDNSPKAYGEELEARFLSGCTADYEGTAATLNNRSTCACMYDVFVQNVPASDEDKASRDGGKTFSGYQGKTFAEIDRAIKEDQTRVTNPEFVPPAVQDKLKACPGFGTRPENVTPATAGPVTTAGPAGPAATAGPVATAGPAATTPGSTAG